MALINKTGITTGGTIQAEHVTRAIDALSGVSTDTIVATGSFTGSFTGNGVGVIGVVSSSFATISNNATSASLATSASQAATASYSITSQTASYVTTAETASYVLNSVSASFASTASYVTQLKQNVTITGSLLASGSITATNNIKNTKPGGALYLTSPNGTEWQITIDNSGVITASASS